MKLNLLLVLSVLIGSAVQAQDFVLEIVEQGKSTKIADKSNIEGSEYNKFYFDYHIAELSKEMEPKVFEYIKDTLETVLEIKFKDAYVLNALNLLNTGSDDLEKHVTAVVKTAPDYFVQVKLFEEEILAINEKEEVNAEFLDQVTVVVMQSNSLLGTIVSEKEGSLLVTLDALKEAKAGLTFTESPFKKYTEEKQEKVLNYFRQKSNVRKDYCNFDTRRIVFTLPNFEDRDEKSFTKNSLRNKSITNPTVFMEEEIDEVIFTRNERFCLGLNSIVTIEDGKANGNEIKELKVIYRTFVYDTEKERKYMGLEEHSKKLIYEDYYDAIDNYIKLTEKN